MDADLNRSEMKQLTEKGIQCAFAVSDTLGCGFLAQCLNSLKATNLRLCLLMNFAKPKLELRRIVNNY